MTALRSRPFPHRLVVVTMDPAWTAVDAAATHPVTAGEVFRGFIRVGSGDDARYGYVAGRDQWERDGSPVCAGILFQVSPSLRIEPTSHPSNGRRYREVGEVAVANDPRLFTELRAGYSR